MKPINLKFGGIGPYPSDVEIDFAALDHLGLFVIAGETGAGKSTIFDAMTYALYGEFANGRTDALMASHLPSRVAPYVEFIFDLRGKRYVVRRTLATKKNSNEKKPGDQTLHEYSGDELVRSTTKVKDVTERIEELIGLEADQFFQVVMIPQNQFREFLNAKDGEKQTLLRALFGTVVYEQIATTMVENARDLASSVQEAKVKMKSLRQRAREIVGDLPEVVSLADLPDVDDDLQAVIAALEASAAILLIEANSAGDARESAVKAFTRADDDAKRFDANTELTEKLKEARSAEKSLEAAKVRLDRHAEASNIVKPKEVLDKASQESKDARQAAEKARKALANLLGRAIARSSALSEVAQLDTKADPKLFQRRLEDARAALNAAADVHSSIADDDAELAEALADKKSLESDAAKARTRLESATEKLKKLKKEEKNLRPLQGALLERQELVRQLNDQLKSADVEGAVARLKSAQGAASVAAKRLDAAQRTFDVEMLRRSEHLAGEMARGLSEGEACPVCGSTEHPSPARPPKGGSKDDLEVLQKATTMCAADKKVADNDLVAAQSAVEDAEAERKKLPTAAKQGKMRTDLEASLRASERLTEIVTEIETAEDVKEEADEEDSSLQGQIKTINGTISAIEKRLRRSKEQVATLTPMKEIDPSLQWCDDVDGQVQELQDCLVLVREREAAEEISRTALESLLLKASFPNAADAIRHVLNDQQLEVDEDIVNKAQARADRINELRGAIGDTPVPASRPDLDVLELKRDEARTAADRATGLHNRVSSAWDELRRVETKIGQLGDDIERQSIVVERCTQVAAVFAGGDNPTDRLALERWVQRSLFELVCLIASERLVALSHGRYRLTLEREGATRARRTFGLDLYVVDAFTGQNRAVQTLSGGEQFLTSLSLALALADVVQQQAGGVDLGALFIDEGFGSLDSDSLEVAVEVLRQLQGTGRMVGVISHVESMQAELPIGLRVEKSQTGSRVIAWAS